MEDCPEFYLEFAFLNSSLLNIEIIFGIINSAIHKAAVRPAAVQNGVWRAFCTAVSFDILGIIPGKPVERPLTVRPAAL